jgi:glycosyltransferase involved in cell wall biosynthesis
LAESIREAASSEPLRGRLLLAGQRTDMPSLLAAMDIFVLPSAREPFGRALIEAMAAGKPVIAMRGGGPDDIVTPEIGILLDDQEPEMLRSAILALAKNPMLRARMGANGRSRVEAFFSVHRMAQAVQEVYGRLLGGCR